MVAPMVCENGILEPFIHQCDLFTETGLGQTKT